MNEINWMDIFNSNVTFVILAAIAIGIWFLVLKKDRPSHSTKR